MDLLTLLSLAFATFIYAISPGPGIFAVLAIATRYGVTPALWLSIGHTITDMLYVSIAIFALGILSALINQSMIYVQMFGAIYLPILNQLTFSYSYRKNSTGFITAALIDW